MCAVVYSFAAELADRSLWRLVTYKARLRPLIGIALAISVFQNSAALADDTVDNNVKDDLMAFEELAVSICQTVPTKSSKEEFSLSVNGKAELSRLIKLLAGINAEVEFDLDSDNTTGVLQKDLARVIILSNNCRLEVLKIVVEFVKSHVSRAPPKISDTNADLNLSPRQPDTREFRVNQIVMALDHLSLYDVADYLISVIPRISGGINCAEMQVMMKKSSEFDRLRLVTALSGDIHRPLPDKCLAELAALVLPYEARELLITLTE